MTEEKIAPEETAVETAASSPDNATPAPEEKPAAEVKPQPAPAEEAEAPETVEAPEAVEATETTEAAEEEEPEEEGKKKKVRHLSLKEVEKKLARARIKMKGDASVYVKHLLARKAELEGGK